MAQMTENERRERIKNRIDEYLRTHEITDPWREQKRKRKKNLYRGKCEFVKTGNWYK